MNPNQVRELMQKAKKRGREEKGEQLDSEARDYLDKLTDAYDIDDEIENLFWGFASKDIVLSYFPSEKKIMQILNDFEDHVNTFIISQPEHEYSYQDELAIEQFKVWLEARLYRGYQGHERKMMTAETHISREFREGLGENDSGGGIREKLGKVFGKGKKEPERSVMEGPPI
jgi:hypothetical protein